MLSQREISVPNVGPGVELRDRSGEADAARLDHIDPLGDEARESQVLFAHQKAPARGGVRWAWGDNCVGRQSGDIPAPKTDLPGARGQGTEKRPQRSGLTRALPPH